MKAGGPTKMQVTSLEAKNSMISENVRVHFEVPQSVRSVQILR